MQQPDPLVIGAASIRGDVRDLILRHLAAQTKLWRDMPQAEQEATAVNIDKMAGALVTQIAVLTATGGRPSVLATLDSMNIGAECKAVLTVPKEHAGALIASTKQIVAIMQPSAASFMGERGPAQTQPDQLSLVDAAKPTAPTVVTPEVLAAIEAICGSSAERTVPESEATLKLQQQALIDGRRPAMMFPTGTKELPLPEGMHIIKTPRGVFHFNPDEIDVVSIVDASNAGEENLVLGLGPHSKAEVMKAAVELNEPALCIVERAPDGTEVLAAVTLERWADEVESVMEDSAAPDHTITREPVEAVLKGRLAAIPNGGAAGITIVGSGGSPKGATTEIIIGAGGGAATSQARSAPRKKTRAKAKKAAKRKANGHDPAPPAKTESPKPSKPTGSPFQ